MEIKEMNDMQYRNIKSILEEELCFGGNSRLFQEHILNKLIAAQTSLRPFRCVPVIITVQ